MGGANNRPRSGPSCSPNSAPFDERRRRQPRSSARHHYAASGSLVAAGAGLVCPRSDHPRSPSRHRPSLMASLASQRLPPRSTPCLSLLPSGNSSSRALTRQASSLIPLPCARGLRAGLPPIVLLPRVPDVLLCASLDFRPAAASLAATENPGASTSFRGFGACALWRAS
jgi:hypothetical protein